jgi:hypothetical protein
MRAARILTAVAAMLATAGAAQAAPGVVIKNAAVRVVVIPEARGDVEAVVARADPALPLSIRKEGDRVIVDGGLGSRMRWFGPGVGPRCGRSANHDRVRVDGRWWDVDALPQVIVRAPLDAEVGARGAVFGSVGRSDSLTLSNAGCGDWTVANVKGALKINDAGSGDVRAGAAGALTVHSAGSGDVSARSAAGPVEIKIAGSGDTAVGQANGSLDVSIAGSGDVHVTGGQVSTMTVQIAGSGDVDLGGSAQSLDVSIAGSGDVRVGQVSGPVHRRVMGSGSVQIGG